MYQSNKYVTPHRSWYGQNAQIRSDGAGASTTSTVPTASTTQEELAENTTNPQLQQLPPQHQLKPQPQQRLPQHQRPVPPPPRIHTSPRSYMSYKRTLEPKWKPLEIPTWRATSHHNHDRMSSSFVAPPSTGWNRVLPPPSSSKILPPPSHQHSNSQSKSRSSSRRRSRSQTFNPSPFQTEHQKHYSPRKELMHGCVNVAEVARIAAPFVSPLQSTSHAIHRNYCHTRTSNDTSNRSNSSNSTATNATMLRVAGRPNRRARSIFDFTRGDVKDRSVLLPPPTQILTSARRN